MRFISTFAGIGGFDLGLERAGMESAAQVEIDDSPGRVLARHWPDVARHRDIRGVGAGVLPVADLLCGGFPCQDVSVAGRRAGLAGERSGLFYEFARLAAEVRPRWLVVENVPGLLSSNGGRDMGAVVGTLGELGYGLAWRVLDAQYFGVAQRRRRLFLVGCLGDPARAAAVLLEPESCGGHPAPRRRAAEDAAGSLGSQPAGGGWRDDTDRMSFVVDMQNAASAGSVGTLQGEGMARQNRGYALALTERGRDGGRNLEWSEGLAFALLNPSDGGRTHERLIAHSPLVEVAEPLDASYAKTTDSAGSNGAGPRNVVIGYDQHNGLMTGPVSPTMTSGADRINRGPAVALPSSGMSVRRLTPVECERLQGFPDDWTEGLSDSARYRCLGNAVCVPVVEWIGRRLLAAEGE